MSATGPTGAGSATTASAPAAIQRQAVVLVHGMGEQMPMQTLRGFVRAVWQTDPNIKAGSGNPIWWKPDARTGSSELSRITTQRGHRPQTGVEGPRTDFYELYWADLTSGNTVGQLKDWFFTLLWRSPRTVPSNVIAVWRLLWALSVVAAIVWGWSSLSAAGLFDPPPVAIKVLFYVVTALYAVAIGFVVAYFGDVARYVRAAPPNIEARRTIRQRGLELLRGLSNDGNYDRIVLAAHSLGTIIAYDVLKLFWSERSAGRLMKRGDSLHRAFTRVAWAARALKRSGASFEASLHAYKQAQGALQEELRLLDVPPADRWIVSDFVSFGAPLTHAPFLLAHDREELKQAIADRRFPISPPYPEPNGGYLYRPDERYPDVRQAHHAAVFAAVRWTNIYDPARAIIFGDLISGPLRPCFGRGIEDVPIRIRRSRWIMPRLFTHTLYWSETPPRSPQLVALRKALNLI